MYERERVRTTSEDGSGSSAFLGKGSRVVGKLSFEGPARIEGTVCELAHGHGMRHCRYRGQPKAHLQHVLTAIAVNIERLSQLAPGQSTSPRPPTTFQDYLDQHDIKRLRSWRAVS